MGAGTRSLQYHEKEPVASMGSGTDRQDNDSVARLSEAGYRAVLRLYDFDEQKVHLGKSVRLGFPLTFPAYLFGPPGADKEARMFPAPKASARGQAHLRATREKDVRQPSPWKEPTLSLEAICRFADATHAPIPTGDTRTCRSPLTCCGTVFGKRSMFTETTCPKTFTGLPVKLLGLKSGGVCQYMW